VFAVHAHLLGSSGVPVPQQLHTLTINLISSITLLLKKAMNDMYIWLLLALIVYSVKKI
jgi:hypothetical protein